MHTFLTVHGNEIAVAAPKQGEMLVGNATEAWQPIEANSTSEIKVLTQQGCSQPCWQSLAELPDHVMQLQQAAIRNPTQNIAIPAIEEIQFILKEILSVLRTFEMIKRP